MLRFSGTGVTDVGLVRASTTRTPRSSRPYVSLVADGVGGAAAGEVASATTVAYVVAAPRCSSRRQPGHRSRPRAAVAAAAPISWPGCCRTSRGGQAWRRRCPRSCATADAPCWATSGDSRVYLLRHGRLGQVSRDHTWVQQLVEEGRITAEWRPHVTRGATSWSAHSTVVTSCRSS